MLFCTVYVIGSLSIKANAYDIYYPDPSSILAYTYWQNLGVNEMATNAVSNGAGGVISGNMYVENGHMYKIVLDNTGDRSTRICFPRLSGNYQMYTAYNSNAALAWNSGSGPMVMEFYANQQLDPSRCFCYGYSGTVAPITFKFFEYVGGKSYMFHYCLEFTPPEYNYSVNFITFSGNYSGWEVYPILFKYKSNLTDNERSSFGYPSTGQSIDELKLQSKEQFEKQIAESKKQHEEQMDTSKVTEVNGIADNLVKSGNEKTKSLLYPVQWAIDTAHNLASAPSTGTITIPVIFGSGTFDIDLTVLERNVPSVWSFIQNFIRFIVALGILRGIFGLFKGVDG